MGGEVGSSASLAPKIGPLVSDSHAINQSLPRSTGVSSHQKVSPLNHLSPLPPSSISLSLLLLLPPQGLSPKVVGENIAKATADWKGLRVTVKLTIQNRQAAVSVVPSASSLVIKALKEPPRDRKKEKNIKHSGNIEWDTILDIARTMRFKSLAKELSGTVKEILGTCQSVGCTVDGQPPHSIIEEIDAGECEGSLMGVERVEQHWCLCPEA